MMSALYISVLCTILAICLSDTNADQGPLNHRLLHSHRSALERSAHRSHPKLPAVPCPQFFEYELRPKDIYGHLTLPAYNPSSNKYAVEVNMTVNAEVPAKAGLRIKLISPQADIFAGKRVQYKLAFPRTKPRTIPHLTQIKVNNNVICKGPTPSLKPGVVQSSMWTKAVIQTSPSDEGNNPYPSYNPNTYPDNHAQYKPYI